MTVIVGGETGWRQSHIRPRSRVDSPFSGQKGLFCRLILMMTE
jgi:hypothetical protein